MKAPRPLEKDIQRAVVSYLDALRIYNHHSPNGATFAGDARRRAIQANAHKAAGTKPGWPDIILLRKTPHGSETAFFEVKREGEKLRPEQEAFRDLCEQEWRLPFAVVRSVQDAKETLQQWGWIA